jgi:hypothetical protein
VVRWGCGGEMLVAFGFGATSVWLMSCVIGYLRYMILTVFKYVEIYRILFESMMVSKSVEVCRFLCIR